MVDAFIITVDAQTQGQRIDKLISEFSGELTRSAVQKILSDGTVTIGGKPVSKNYKVKNGDRISVVIPKAKPLDVLPEDIPLDIRYEDDDLLVVNKPKGMVVHPAAGNYEGTLVNALLHHCEGSLSGINGVIRPGIVHRIDKDTSGLLIVAKNDFAHLSLAEQIKAHSFTREYQTVVYGHMNSDHGTVDAPIGRHPTDRKKWLLLRKTASLQLRIMRSLRLTVISPICLFALKPAALIRSACIWPISAIRSPAIRFMGRKR